MIFKIQNSQINTFDGAMVKINPGYIFSAGVWRTVLAIEDGEKFEKQLASLTDDEVKEVFAFICKDESDKEKCRAESLILCEREIARRGLHIENNKERFDL